MSKLTPKTLVEILPQVFALNLIRSRGLFVTKMLFILSGTKGHDTDATAKVFASLTSVINTKLPQIGELLVKRVLFEFRRNFKNHKIRNAITRLKLLSHLINQQI